MRLSERIASGDSRRSAIAMLLGLTVLAGGAIAADAQFGGYWSNDRVVQFTIDVAEDMNRYSEHRTDPGEEPLRGSTFVTEGRIFQAGTIPTVGGDQFDPNLPGSQGTWFCKGVFLVKGSEFDKSPVAVVSDQVYLMPDDQKAILTAGTEGNGLSVRAVTGGTGSFAGYVGEQRQQFLGFNKTGGVNLRVTFILRRAPNR
jgi:hypothetical protein